MSSWIRLGVLAVLMSFAACKEKNSQYCEGHPEDTVNCPIDASTVCTDDGQCPGQVCDTASGACVQCTPAKAQACTGMTPVCGSDNTCQACQMHAQCPASNVCLPDGACGDEAQVAYVDPAGTDNATCTRTMPCTKVTKALATNRPYIKLKGTTDEAATITIDSQNVTLLGDPGAALTRTSNGILLEIRGTSQVRIHDLEIKNATGMVTTGIGISLPAGNTATLSLLRVKVDNNQGAGISASGGTLTVSQSTISGNQGGGISASGGTLTVSQSTISGNQGGGISMTGAVTFDITNNFIVRNGNSTTATVGGAFLRPMGASVFMFNTVTDNQIATSITGAGGVLCDTAGFSGPNNIIVRNFVNNDPGRTNSNINGQCAFPTSKIAATVAGLNFVSPDTPPHDYHINAGSSAIDQATTASTIATDFDGDSRPQGSERDQGADELKP